MENVNFVNNNKQINWEKIYDFYEVELRGMYQTISKSQNDSHFEMLKNNAKNYLSKDKTFCEIGFGAGLTLRKALKYFGKVYGLDISPRNVEITFKELIMEGYRNFELYVSDLKNYDPRFENKFDVITFIHGLEHFKNEEYPIIFNNIKRYLKRNGIFTGALPYKNNFNYRMCPNCNYVFEIDGHVSSHDLKTLRDIFTKNGFTIKYLSNFNLKYLMSKGNIFKKIGKLIFYSIFRHKRISQNEFIVKLNT